MGKYITQLQVSESYRCKETAYVWHKEMWNEANRFMPIRLMMIYQYIHSFMKLGFCIQSLKLKFSDMVNCLIILPLKAGHILSLYAWSETGRSMVNVWVSSKTVYLSRIHTEAWEGHRKENFLPRGIFSRPRGIFSGPRGIFFAAGNIFWAAGNIFCRGEYFLGRGEYFLPRGIFSRPRGILLHSFPRGIFSGPRGISFAAGNIFSAAGNIVTFRFRGEYLISAGNIWFRG